MAYIQCSLTGTALDWYTNLHISYKQQWNSFVQLFKKQFSSQKTAYYAQVEAMSLMKKDNETVRHFALRVQQLVKKGWCNENATSKIMKSLQRDYPKNQKILPINDKLYMYQHYLNLQCQFTHLLDMSILKTLLTKK